MSEKIQLQHPQGKNAVRIDADKYEVMSQAIISVLKDKPLTHTEMTTAVNALFKKMKLTFDGSVEWYMESVKLHLEALKQVERIKEGGKLKFSLK